jgi:hypothetical protein
VIRIVATALLTLDESSFVSLLQVQTKFFLAVNVFPSCSTRSYERRAASPKLLSQGQKRNVEQAEIVLGQIVGLRKIEHKHHPAAQLFSDRCSSVEVPDAPTTGTHGNALVAFC